MQNADLASLPIWRMSFAGLQWMGVISNRYADLQTNLPFILSNSLRFVVR